MRAYETLQHETQRRAYDLIYPSIKAQRTSSQNTQRPCPTTTPSPQAETASEAAQIAALSRSIAERTARWSTTNKSFESSIFELKRVIRRVEQDITGLNSIFAAEAAVEAQRNSWSTWLLSPLFKKVEVSDEEKERRDRERQERRIEMDIKDRRLSSNRESLAKMEDMQRRTKAELDATNRKDEILKQDIRARIQARETRQRQEKERAEYDARMKAWRAQQELRLKQEREAAEALRRQQAARQAAEQRRQQEEAKEREELLEQFYARLHEQHPHTYSHTYTHPTSSQPRSRTCSHGGWWDKVHGRTACPECHKVWNYLLQCPGCSMNACSKCQASIRPRFQRNTHRRAHTRVRTPSPDYRYGDDW